MTFVLAFAGVARADELTVHDGTATNGYVPVYGFYADAYLKAEYVIPADDLAAMAGGTVNGMTFYATQSSVSWGAANFQVFLTEVGSTTISAFNGPGTVVYEGPLSIVDGQMVVTFTTPYDYNGGNLLVGFYNTVKGSYVTSTWYGETVNGASVQGYNYNGLDAVSPTQRNFLPKTTFSYDVGGDCEKPYDLAISEITPHTAFFQWYGGISGFNVEYKKATDDEWIRYATNVGWNVLFVNLDANTDYQARVESVCEDGVTTSGFKTISFTTLESCPAPSNLTVLEVTETTATLSWNRGNEETEWKLIRTTDNAYISGITDTVYTLQGLIPNVLNSWAVVAVCDEDDESAWSNTVTFEPTDKVVIGLGGTATNQYIPTYTLYCYSLTQQIYTAEEIGMEGMIMSVDFYNASTSARTRQLDIYMVNTDKGEFASSYDWVTAAEADLVFSGEVTFAAQSWTTIELDEAFAHNGESNMALIVDDNTGSYESAINFYAFDAPSQAIRIYSDGTNYQPLAPDNYSGTILNQKNQIRLDVEEEDLNFYTVNVTTESEYTGSVSGSGLFAEGRDITITATPRNDAYGYYRFLYWTDGNGVNIEDNPYTFTLTENVEFVAHFEEMPMYSPTVIVNPEGTGAYSVANPYHIYFYEGDTIIFDAGPLSDLYYFVNWTDLDGNIISEAHEFSYVLTSDVTLIANFAPIPVNIVVNPDTLDLGPRPNGAWMRPYTFTMSNLGFPAEIQSIATDNAYFTVETGNLAIPFTIDYYQTVNLGVASGEGNGVINGNLLVAYASEDNTEEVSFELIATAYTPVAGDVWENPIEVTAFPYTATYYSANYPLYDNYVLPPRSTADGPDAVYKLTFTEDTYLNANVIDGEGGKVALYREGFKGLGGPDVNNNYKGPELAIEEWLYYDNGEWYDSWRSNTGVFDWGILFTPDQLANYPDCKLTKVALYDTEYNIGTHVVNIYKGGDTPGNGTLLHSQSFEATSDYTWHEVILNAIIPIDVRQNLWITMHYDGNDGYPASACTNMGNPNGRWFSTEGEAYWGDHGSGTWMIRGLVTNSSGREVVLGDGGHREEHELTVYEGSNTSSYIPAYILYFDEFTKSQFVIPAEDLQEMAGGSISSLKFYTTSQNVPYTTTTTAEVYLMEVDYTSIYAYEPKENGTIVYQGTLDIVDADGGGEMTINFNTPYTYNGGNLLVGIDNITQGEWKSIYFYGQSVDGASVGNHSASSFDEIPVSQQNFIPKTTFTYEIDTDSITDMTVTPGTYYLVASSTSDEWTVEINTGTVPCPEVAYNPVPDNGAMEVEPAGLNLAWCLGDRTTSYRLLFGTDPNNMETLVDWTRDLSNHYQLSGIYNNTIYYWRVDQRNDGCSSGVEGELWSFTTHLNTPYNLWANNEYMFEGDWNALYWDAPEMRGFQMYNVYRNDELIGSTTENYFEINDLTYNMDGYRFNVTAVYDEGESAYSNGYWVWVSGYGSVEGYVYEQDGATPIANARVTFTGYDEFGWYRNIQYTTDENGQYGGSLYVGSYDISASCSGYQPKYYGWVYVPYNETISGIDFILDETFTPVGNVVAEYYPDANNPNSPYVKVYWSNTVNLTENFETSDFSQYDWQLDPTYPWFITDNYPYEGNYCMRSGNQYMDGTTSWMQVEVNVPYDGYVTFNGRVSSEGGWDYGRFYIDGYEQQNWSGEYDWFEASYPVTAGMHTFNWQYTKDGSVSSGDDCFYVDNINFASMEPTRSFQNYRVYRTDEYNNGPFHEDNTVVLSEATNDTVYLDNTWPSVPMGGYKFGVSRVYEGNREGETNQGELKKPALNCVSRLQQKPSGKPCGDVRDIVMLSEDFDNGLPGGWNTIDGGSPSGYGWQLGSVKLGSTGNGHNGSADMMISQSYDNSYGVIYPDNYLITPQVELGGIFSFWACAQDAGYAAEHFGVAVSTTNNYDPNSFTTIQEWTLSAKGRGAKTEVTRSGNRSQGNWYYYEVDLSDYSGLGYVAIRHFNCSDQFYLNVDDVELILLSQPVQGPRESRITWSNDIAKDMLLNGVNVTVTLNSGDTPEGTVVSFVNQDWNEQQAHPVADIVLDESGYYAWDWFRKGDYYVTITKEGYTTVTDYVSIYEPTALQYQLEEIMTGISDLYVSRTGWATWNGPGNDGFVTPNNNSTFEFGFENDLEGWTNIDADGDGHVWYHSSEAGSHSTVANNSHNGIGHVKGESYCNNGNIVLYPDNYLVSPQQYRIKSGSTLSFWACTGDTNYPSEHFGVAISTASNTNSYDFTTIAEWTITAKSAQTYEYGIGRDGLRAGPGSWYQFSCDLSSYAGRSVWIALRHFDCSDMFVVNIDDVTLNAGAKSGDRHLEAVQVMLSDQSGNILYTGETENDYMQLPVESLVEGQTYHLAVGSVYSSGLSNWEEVDWVYEPCDNYEGATDLIGQTLENGVMLSWTYPEVEERVSQANSIQCNVHGTLVTQKMPPINDPGLNFRLTPTVGNNAKGLSEALSNRGLDAYCICIYGNVNDPNNAWDRGLITFNLTDPSSFSLVNNNENIYTAGNAFGLDYCPLDGYYYTYKDYILYKIDINTGEILNQIGVNVDLRDGAWDITTNTMYSIYNSSLYTVDLNTGEAYYVGYMGMNMVALACDTYGQLYAFEMNNGGNAGLYQIDKMTGASTFVGYTGVDAYYAQSATFDHSTGILYWAQSNYGSDNFYSVNTFTGEATLLLAGSGEASGLCIPASGDFVGAMIFRDGEYIGLAHGSTFFDEGGNNLHEYQIRVVYGGEANCPDENFYLAMSCPQSVEVMGPVVTQTTHFAEGWNWWSTYVNQERIDGLSLLEEGLDGNGLMIKSQNNGFVTYQEGMGWYGSLESIDNESAYQVRTSAACTVSMATEVVVPEEHPITLNPGWTWVGYPSAVSMSVANAMADFEPAEGDMLKSQEGYAMFYPELGWIGSLRTLIPGMGLMYHSNGTAPVNLTYATGERAGETEENITARGNHWAPNPNAYRDNMTVLAVVELDGVELGSDRYELAAFANGVCLGSAKLMKVDALNRYMAFLTVGGEGVVELNFGLYDAETGMVSFESDDHLDFVANAITGNPTEPFVVSFRGTTGIDEQNVDVNVYPNPVDKGSTFNIGLTADANAVQVDIVNALGVVVESVSTSAVQTMKAPETAGVYTLRITVDGKRTYIRKLIVR